MAAVVVVWAAIVGFGYYVGFHFLFTLLFLCVFFFRMVLQETFVVQDYLFYDAMTSSSGHWSNTSSLGINEYSSNGWKLGNRSSYGFILCDYVPNTPFELSWVATERSRQEPTIHIDSNNYFETITAGSMNINGTACTGTYELNKEYHLRIYSDKIEAYKEDTLIGSKSVSTSNPTISFGVGANRYLRVKDFKIKAL